MIRTPAQWRCSDYQAAFVECDGRRTCLCRVVPCPSWTAAVVVDSAVVVDPSKVPYQRSQDVVPTERHRVEPLDVSRFGDGLKSLSAGAETFAYAICDGDDERAHHAANVLTAGEEPPLPNITLCILSATNTNVASSVTLTGPRFDARATPAELSAVLSGCYVIAGAQVHACGELYTVTHVEVKHGHGGVSLVKAGCRIKVNDLWNRKAGRHGPSGIIGLEHELHQLQTVFSVAGASPGQCFNALVHGPRGCGVRSLVDASLASASASPEGCKVVSWSPSLDAALVRHRCRSRVIALVIPHCERYFCVDGEEADEGAAALAVRKLLRDVSLLLSHSDSAACTSSRSDRGYDPAVVVVAFTHHYSAVSSAAQGGSPIDGVFSTNIALNLPDAADRATLLASVRGVSPSACMDEAHSLVGRSRAEVLAAARGPTAVYRPPFTPVRWDDIGGLDNVKARLHRALVWPQQHPEVFTRFGLAPPKGILLYGPPGCAKTTLVKALCSEGYFSLIYLDSANVISAYVGEGERRLRDVFRRAAHQAPCIVFFDEVEVIGARRATEGGGKDAENVRLLSTLLTEMDGFAAANGVCFVGATNVPHLIDDALLRPGRFDYLVHVPLPDHDDRERILHLFLDRTAADISRIASGTDGFSGADISALCTTALLSLDSGSSLEAPSCLQDQAWVTSYFLEQASRFKRTDYDARSLALFERQHAAA